MPTKVDDTGFDVQDVAAQISLALSYSPFHYEAISVQRSLQGFLQIPNFRQKIQVVRAFRIGDQNQDFFHGIAGMREIGSADELRLLVTTQA